MASRIDWVNNHPSPQIAALLAGVPQIDKQELFASSWLCIDPEPLEASEVLRRYRVLNWILFNWAYFRLHHFSYAADVNPADEKQTQFFAEQLWGINIIKTEQDAEAARNKLADMYYKTYEHYGDYGEKTEAQAKRTALAQDVRNALAEAYFCTSDVTQLHKAVTCKRIAVFFPKSGIPPGSLLTLIEELCAIKA